MLFKRGSTISAAEGGCQAEVGGKFANELIRTRCECFAVACSMAAGGFAACMVSCLYFRVGGGVITTDDEAVIVIQSRSILRGK